MTPVTSALLSASVTSPPLASAHKQEHNTCLPGPGLVYLTFFSMERTVCVQRRAPHSAPLPNPTQTPAESPRRPLISLLLFVPYFWIYRGLSRLLSTPVTGGYHTVGESRFLPCLGSGTPISLAYLEIFPSGRPLRNAGKPFSIPRKQALPFVIVVLLLFILEQLVTSHLLQKDFQG